jgi:formylglycine-generating enzyme required for sulfatase activity
MADMTSSCPNLAMCMASLSLAAMLPIGADTVQPSLSQVEIIPPASGRPPSFSGVFGGGFSNGTAMLEASTDLGVADPWSIIATAPLDHLGSAAFGNISDPRPQAATAERVFFRVATTPAFPPGTMVFIPGGTFRMGDAFAEAGTSERPVHGVHVSGFYLSNTEVTKAQWDAVQAWGLENGYTDAASLSGAKAATHPVGPVTWEQAVKHCNARSEMEGLTPCYTASGAVYRTGTDFVACDWNANGYRLPTEAEWEKAARGGLDGKRFPWGDTLTHVMANYTSSTTYPYDVSPTRGAHPAYKTLPLPYTSPVAAFPANGYGLHDMTGNLWEWCWDRHDSGYYAVSPDTDPRGPTSGSQRVLRGGA